MSDLKKKNVSSGMRIILWLTMKWWVIWATSHPLHWGLAWKQGVRSTPKGILLWEQDNCGLESSEDLIGRCVAPRVHCKIPSGKSNMTRKGMVAHTLLQTPSGHHNQGQQDLWEVMDGWQVGDVVSWVTVERAEHKGGWRSGGGQKVGVVQYKEAMALWERGN